MQKIVLSFIAATFAVTANAQSFPKPPDVPAYVEVTPTYAAGTTLNVVGDGSSTGGNAPALAYELADIPTVTRAPYIDTASAPQPETNLTGGPGSEAKARFTIENRSEVRFDDPIRNYGQPGTSHCHTFFGNTSTNAWSTFATLRNTPPRYARAKGRVLNATGYWFPCLMKVNPFGNGKNYALKPKSVTLYYVNNPADSIKIHQIPLGLRYVGGYDMDSGGLNAGYSNYMKDLVDAANAQPGTAGRYKVCQGVTEGTSCATFAQWSCTSTGAGQLAVDALKTAAGADAFGGNCVSGDDLWVQFSGPTCWDGVNLWSPGGYKHVIPAIGDSVKGGVTCPNGWYQLPALQLQIHFANGGPSDYLNWVLSSDIAAGKTDRPGITFHTDWFGGWDKTTFLEWQDYCIAVGNRGNTVPRECNSSTINPNVTLINTPLVNTAVSNATAADMIEIPTSQSGPATIHVHGS